MKFWHLQMHLPEGKGGIKIKSKDMLSEPTPIIGTGEWSSKQCTDFKETMSIGDIVMVREGNKAIALCQVESDNFYDSALEEKYINVNYRKVRILDWAKKRQPENQLFSQGTLSPCASKDTRQYKFISNWYNAVLKNQNMKRIIRLLEDKKNIILQGAPGTGKTYKTAEIALALLGKDTGSYATHEALMADYEKMHEAGQIGFVTFHQSMDYEDFIEGLKPETEEGNVQYKVKDGIFKVMCNKASSPVESNFDEVYKSFLEDISEYTDEKPFKLKTKTGADFGVCPNSRGNLSLFTTSDFNYKGVLHRSHIEETAIGEYIPWKSYYKAVVKHLQDNYNLKIHNITESKNYVLIIDEINRGNVSKIFGEIITLLEADKRSNGAHPLSVTLPYSQDKFAVPSNLYIIGTMNTTDRSVGNIDYAVRRRFAFVTLESQRDVLKNYNYDKEGTKTLALRLFDAIKTFLEKNKLDMDINDLMVGHSYFLAKDEDGLLLKWQYEILPLLCEYYKDGVCKSMPQADMQQFIKDNTD